LVDREAAAEEAGNLWTAVDVLMGLRYSKELIESLLRRDSSHERIGYLSSHH
jgi:hypothetical protein